VELQEEQILVEVIPLGKVFERESGKMLRFDETKKDSDSLPLHVSLF
jgi:hypothetical protein